MRVVAVGVLALCVTASAAATPDAMRGEQIYSRCLACHALGFDRVGPRHCGLFGRMAGSVPGFDYSLAMKNSKIRWNEKTLDRFLAKPLAMVPEKHDDLRRCGRSEGPVGFDCLSETGQPVGRVRQVATGSLNPFINFVPIDLPSLRGLAVELSASDPCA